MTVKIIADGIRILMIGCGPHGRTFYIPTIRRLSNNFIVRIEAIVELEAKQEDTRQYCNSHDIDARLIFTPPLPSSHLPTSLEAALDNVVLEKQINAVIICTDPLNHISYARWALGRGLHLLLDKPVSTRINAVSSLASATGIWNDYLVLAEEYSRSRIRSGNLCSLCVHRRYHPGIRMAEEIIGEISGKTGCPVTNIHGYHSDGQWRFPDEMTTQTHHSYFEGNGKVSHSGFHFLDCLVRFWKAGSVASGKDADSVSVQTQFMFPQSHEFQLGTQDYIKIFGTDYQDRLDRHKARNMPIQQYGELDAEVTFSFIKDDYPVTFAHLSLLHNGFSRRSWLAPGNDLYKGNGRVKHEEHRVHVGPFMCLYLLSWQAKDKHAITDDQDKLPGGNNHFDIHVFRNSDLVGGDPYAKFSLDDLARNCHYDLTRLIIEQIKEQCVSEFFSVVTGRLPRGEMKSDLLSHELAVKLMSAVYESHIKRHDQTGSVIVPINRSLQG